MIILFVILSINWYFFEFQFFFTVNCPLLQWRQSYKNSFRYFKQNRKMQNKVVCRSFHLNLLRTVEIICEIHCHWTGVVVHTAIEANGVHKAKWNAVHKWYIETIMFLFVGIAFIYEWNWRVVDDICAPEDINFRSNTLKWIIHSQCQNTHNTPQTEQRCCTHFRVCDKSYFQ